MISKFSVGDRGDGSLPKQSERSSSAPDPFFDDGNSFHIHLGGDVSHVATSCWIATWDTSPPTAKRCNNQ